MFDRRLICNERKCVSTEMWNAQDTLEGFELILDKVLLFDYIYGLFDGSIYVSDVDATCYNALYMSKQTAAHIQTIFKNYKGQGDLSGFRPVCGQMLNIILSDLDISKFYLAFFAPSQSYDTCCMQWDAYRQIYRAGYKSYTEDEYFQIYQLENQHCQIWNFSYLSYLTEDMQSDPKFTEMDGGTNEFEKKTTVRAYNASTIPTAFIGPTYLSTVFDVMYCDVLI